MRYVFAVAPFPFTFHIFRRYLSLLPYQSDEPRPRPRVIRRLIYRSLQFVLFRGEEKMNMAVGRHSQMRLSRLKLAHPRLYLFLLAYARRTETPRASGTWEALPHMTDFACLSAQRNVNSGARQLFCLVVTLINLGQHG